ncbi:MAG: hypothetical protein M3270_01550 [Thermoproteota archaeon]|nr:hypothetical protein [Thermoproteota archaeon]
MEFSFSLNVLIPISINGCLYNIQLLFYLTNGMEKDFEHKEIAGDQLVEDRKKSDASKNIKKGIESYEEKVMSGETPAADATRSDE